MSRIIIDLMADDGTEIPAEEIEDTLSVNDHDDLTADEVLTALQAWGDFWKVASDFGLMGNATIFVRVEHKRPKGRTVRTYAEWSLE